MPVWSLFSLVQCYLVGKISIFTTPSHRCGSLEGTSSLGTALGSRFFKGKMLYFGFSAAPHSAVWLVSPKSSAAPRFVLKYLNFMNKSSTQLVAWVFTLHMANKRGNKLSPPVPGVSQESTVLTDFSISATSANTTISINTERLSMLHPLTSERIKDAKSSIRNLEEKHYSFCILCLDPSPRNPSHRDREALRMSRLCCEAGCRLPAFPAQPLSQRKGKNNIHWRKKKSDC